MTPEKMVYKRNAEETKTKRAKFNEIMRWKE
jgi:hypothetical protein